MSLPPRFVRHDGSFEDWAEGYWNGCVRPDEKTETIARHAFQAGREGHSSDSSEARCPSCGVRVESIGNPCPAKCREQSQVDDGVRAAAEAAYLAWRDWMAGCDNGTKVNEVEAAHIRLRDALAIPHSKTSGGVFPNACTHPVLTSSPTTANICTRCGAVVAMPQSAIGGEKP